MNDSILNNCDPVTNLKDAQKPIITVLLPIKGLRHDAEGEVTADGVNIVLDGIKNLGVNLKGADLQSVVVAETKKVVSMLNAQYEFLISGLINSLNKSEPIPRTHLDLIKEKSTAIKDVLSISRQILSKEGSGSGSGSTQVFIEGFVNNSGNGQELKETLEAFEEMTDNLNNDSAAITEQRYSDIKRKYDISVEKNKGVSANLALYSFLNVVAVGLLFYIVSAK
jgi:hypothetical protein